MPWKAYTDKETGNLVTALRVEHEGILTSSLGPDNLYVRYQEGDYLVRFPTDLFEERKETVVSASMFQKRFLRVGTDDRVNWEALGWRTQ